MTQIAIETPVAQADPIDTKAFAPFEWMIALRYLRARRAQGFVSVIAGFSFTGIMLGVATLIVVMSVMNGFHIELMGKIIGINGHVFIQALETPLTDFNAVVDRISKTKGVTFALPMVESAAGKRILVDTSPDLRSQLIANDMKVADDFDAKKFVNDAIAAE